MRCTRLCAGGAHLAGVHQDALCGGVVREVQSREEVVDRVVVEPQVEPRAVERQVHLRAWGRGGVRG